MRYLAESSNSSRIASSNRVVDTRVHERIRARALRRFARERAVRLQSSVTALSAMEVVLDPRGDNAAIGHGGEPATEREREFPAFMQLLLDAGEQLMDLLGARIEAMERAERAVVLERHRALVSEAVGDLSAGLELDRSPFGGTEPALQRRIHNELE